MSKRPLSQTIRMLETRWEMRRYWTLGIGKDWIVILAHGKDTKR